MLPPAGGAPPSEMGAPVEPPTLSHHPSVRLPCAVCAPSSPAAVMEQEDRLQEEQGERGRAVLCGPRIWREGYHEASGLGAYLYLWHGSAPTGESVECNSSN